MSVTRKVFGPLPGDRTAYLYELVNVNGMRVVLTDIGCAVVSLQVPDNTGGTRDVVFGFDNAEGYTVNPSFFGVVVGRVGNRIKDGAFTLDGHAYQLEKNDGGHHHLHGGSNGFDKKLWRAEAVNENGNTVTFTHISPDGDAGYPGVLTARVTYTLTEDNTLRIDYTAETDAKTLCNLTNHSYFNLEGYNAKDIYAHEMQILAGHITAVDETLIPTGMLDDVTGTPFDFRQAKPIGRDIDAAGGYDHNFVLDGEVAARVYAPASGIAMEVRTSSPGMQFYSGNFLNGNVAGKNGVRHTKQSGFCLETQLFPDAIHQAHFPSCIVERDKPQRFFTEFAFSCR